MGNAATYIPATHCLICVQLGKLTAATSTVVAEQRDYQACDEHAIEIQVHGLIATLDKARRDITGGAA